MRYMAALNFQGRLFLKNYFLKSFSEIGCFI